MFCRVLKSWIILSLFVAPSFAAADLKRGEDSYMVVQARVQALEAKVRSGEADLKKLIEEKQRTKDSVRIAEIVHEMKDIHKSLEQNIKEYDQQRSLLKYRYPEKNGTSEREYERIELRSLKDMESQISLGSSLQRTMHKVRSQYPLKSDNKGSGVDAKPASSPVPGLTSPVIIKK